MTVFNARVRELRPAFLPPDPAGRTSYRPGELAQFDLWQPDIEIPLGHGQADKLWGDRRRVGVLEAVRCPDDPLTADP